MYDRQKLEELRQAMEKWEETTLQQAQTRLPERQGAFMTTSSEPIERLYTPLDVAEMDYLDDLGLPGEYPFTRGVHPTMHRGKLWTMRMFAGFGTAEETNARFKHLLEQGQTGLSIAFDLPTLMSYALGSAASVHPANSGFTIPASGSPGSMKWFDRKR